MLKPNLVDRLLAAELRRRRRHERLTYAAMWLLLACTGMALSGWSLMLAVMVVHTVWIPALPGLGYWWAVLLSVLLRGALAPWGQRKAAK